MTTGVTRIPRIETGLPGLDAILGGGLPERSVTVIAGAPGTGKTILAQQICFHQATVERPCLYFNSLSAPPARGLLYLGQFGFFDPAKLATSVQLVDLGGVARTRGLDDACAQIAEHVERVRPAVVVIDSFRVLEEMAASRAELRRASYELAVQLMVWDCTSLLLGEYAPPEIDSNPLFSVVDGLILLRRPRIARERRLLLEVVKMRGTAHDRRSHPFTIGRDGIDVPSRRPAKDGPPPVRGRDPAGGGHA